MLRAFGGRDAREPLPLLLHAAKYTTEELEAASPFRRLAPDARREAKSPLMLLPFCQVNVPPARCFMCSDAF